jgi:hypothetical protein
MASASWSPLLVVVERLTSPACMYLQSSRCAGTAGSDSDALLYACNLESWSALQLIAVGSRGLYQIDICVKCTFLCPCASPLKVACHYVVIRDQVRAARKLEERKNSW